MTKWTLFLALNFVTNSFYNTLFAQSLQVDFSYLNPDYSFEERLTPLVNQMTLDEKISQLTNDASAIPLLKVPAYNWWNECLLSVARAGFATVFPQSISVAASFNKGFK